jgi:hypothetical protein
MSIDEHIKLSSDGKPYKSEETANAALRKSELSPDVWGVYQREGGWVLAKHVAIIKEQAAAEQARAEYNQNKELANEKYFRVIFPERTGPHDTENVEIAHQGTRITIKRGVEVVLPQRFLGVCDNAVVRVFEPAARGVHAYQQAGLIKRRPYTKIGEATREEFLQAWDEGNTVTRREVAAAGGKANELGGTTIRG